MDGPGRVYFKHQTLIFTYLFIDQSIDQFIDGRTKWTEGQIIRKAGSSTRFPTDLSMETHRRLTMEKIDRRDPN